MLSYDNVVDTTSETDEDGGLTNSGLGRGRGEEEEEVESPVGVPSLEASPRVGHTPLSSEGSEGREGLQDPGWRHGDDTDGHLSGESHDLSLLMSAGFSAVVSWSFGRKQIPSCRKSNQSNQQSPEDKRLSTGTRYSSSHMTGSGPQ